LTASLNLKKYTVQLQLSVYPFESFPQQLSQADNVSVKIPQVCSSVLPQGFLNGHPAVVH
jgi:hypothetical protein